MKKRVFSGIQPTGELHIGNYLGALKNWVGLIDKYDCIFCIVDLHAITIEYDVAMMQKRIFDAACINMACGLDPLKCTLFVQSDVIEHTELTWILDTVTPFGELSRMTQFKDKSQQNADNVNVGLFNYPVLMASDIMLYDALIVPVGQDQVQHLEFTREVVRAFNRRFGEVFSEPKELLSEAKKIIGLDGEKKMSKSMNNYISLSETADSLKKKLMGAKTDPARVKRDDAGNPDICNIYSLHKFFTPDAELKGIYDGCRSAGIGCVDCKRALQKNILEELAPIQEKKAQMEKTPDLVYDVLNEGAKRCKMLAEEKIAQVKDAMGLLRK